ncbi:MAG: O-succinylbenzoate synthase, partial [Mycobacterium sp.]
AGALPGTGFAAELGLAALLAGDVVSAGRTLRPVDGHLPVAPMPAAPDPEQIRRFAASAEATARWRARLDRVRKAL